MTLLLNSFEHDGTVLPAVEPDDMSRYLRLLAVCPTPADSGDHHAPYPRLSYLVGRLDRAVRRQLEDAVRPQGVTVAGYTVLSLLADDPGQSNAQLARRSLVSPQAMNEVLRRLTDDRLVRRKASPEHARVQLASLTARGRQVLEACDGAADAVETHMTAGLADRRVDQLRRDLLRAARLLERLHAGS
jgi:DNA-binding MarR family transcriptional regulator